MGSNNRSKGLVLVVEDELLLAELVEDVLQDAGYQTLSAGDGRSALEMLTMGAVSHDKPGNTSGDVIDVPTQPDLVISDLMMPVMTGWELCSTIAADPNYS